MDYKKLLCSVMLLGSFGTSTLVAYGEEKQTLPVYRRVQVLSILLVLQ